MEYQHQPLQPLGPPAPPPQLLPPAPPPPLPSLPQLHHQHTQQDEDRWSQYHIWRQHVFVNGQCPHRPPCREPAFSADKPRTARAELCRAAPTHARPKRESTRPLTDNGVNFSLDRDFFVSVMFCPFTSRLRSSLDGSLGAVRLSARVTMSRP